MSIDMLKEQVKSGRLGNLYLFYGPEDYLKRYYLECIENSILSPDTRTLNKVVMDGKIEIQRLMDYCETLPVFSTKKLAVVKNSDMFKSRSKDDGENTRKKPNDEFIDYLKQIPEYTCLLFYEDEIDKRLKTVDVIKKKWFGSRISLSEACRAG